MESLINALGSLERGRTSVASVLRLCQGGAFFIQGKRISGIEDLEQIIIVPGGLESFVLEPDFGELLVIGEHLSEYGDIHADFLVC